MSKGEKLIAFMQQKDVDYFMDDLQSWEVYDLYNSLQYADSP